MRGLYVKLRANTGDLTIHEVPLELEERPDRIEVIRSAEQVAYKPPGARPGMWTVWTVDSATRPAWKSKKIWAFDRIPCYAEAPEVEPLFASLGEYAKACEKACRDLGERERQAARWLRPKNVKV